MVPRSLYESRIVPEGEKGSDAMAAYLYGFLDLRQGKGNRPTEGYRFVAKKIGWQTRTVADYARLLSRVGLIHLDEGDPRAASTQASMLVIHNPSREVVNPLCTVTDEASKAGSRYDHKPHQAPSIANAETRPLARATHDRDDRPLARRAHDEEMTPGASNAPPPRAPNAPPSCVKRATPRSTPGASDAPQSRSKRYEVGLDAGFRAREGNTPEPLAPEVSAISRLAETFGPVEIVEEAPVLCAACGAPADGQPASDGSPMCRSHEPWAPELPSGLFDLPLDQVGACRVCRSTTATTDGVGAICHACHLGGAR